MGGVGFDNQIHFDLLSSHFERDRYVDPLVDLQRKVKVCWCDIWSFRHDDGSTDLVAELADIAGPEISLNGLNRVSVEALHPFLIVCSYLLEEHHGHKEDI